LKLKHVIFPCKESEMNAEYFHTFEMFVGMIPVVAIELYTIGRMWIMKFPNKRWIARYTFTK